MSQQAERLLQWQVVKHELARHAVTRYGKFTAWRETRMLTMLHDLRELVMRATRSFFMLALALADVTAATHRFAWQPALITCLCALFAEPLAVLLSPRHSAALAAGHDREFSHMSDTICSCKCTLITLNLSASRFAL